MKTSTEHINALNDLAEGETLELNFDPMSELGEWKDVHGFPNYQINNEGAFMNKHTLKMLKHFRHKDSECGAPAVTLYKGGQGHVLDVQLLLLLHFGPDAVLPPVTYNNDKVTEIAPSLPYGSQTKGPKAKTKPYKTKAVDPIWDTI